MPREQRAGSGAYRVRRQRCNFVARKSTKRRQKPRRPEQQRRPFEVPVLVMLAVSDRMGARLTRSQTVFRGRLLVILGPVVFVAAFVFGEGIFEGLLFLSIALLAFAFGQWRAIQWLDQKQAWRSVRR